MQYYLVSYVSESVFGNIFFRSKEELDIRKAEEMISEGNNKKNTIILCINQISKTQFVKSKKE